MKEALTIGTGAALGALARYALTALLSAAGANPLWPLLLINVAGSAAMGYAKPGKFWGTGVLGGFTSFAAFALLTYDLDAGWALAYVLATLIGCVGAYLLGHRVGVQK
ncbi:hypothetical protein CPHO_02710 [Corynebacterium phocae]|uniref:Fluoride-specific ion channel FluC n=1 Tax=Corynebacterium phocae TaxID=161895 RepID=A0A1L7D1H7_9CORY|nr:fluoride efflux transporter family protein [Corynebacterium phocae]APT91989.1 hypothetical protein CPHO_02710 [Corynebacterium phocae]KAA8726365.1 fluoride efflux transporter family protein [Corynebacterium phocae]